MRTTLATMLLLVIFAIAIRPATGMADGRAVPVTGEEEAAAPGEDPVPDPGTLLNGTWVVVKAGTRNARQVKTSDDSIVWVVPAPVVHPGSTGSGAAPKGARVAALIPMPNRDSRSPAEGISLSGEGLGKQQEPLFGAGAGSGRGRGGWQEKAKEAAVAVAVGAGIAVAFVAALYLILLITAGLAALAEAREHRPTTTIVHEFDIED